MLFSETLASMQAVDQGWSAVIGEDWSQGRGAFGGMVAALGNEAMRRLVPADRQLRGLETVFVGPAFPGAVRMQAEILRVGKAVTIASARLWSGEQIAATFTGIYGAPRVVADFACTRGEARECARPRICRTRFSRRGRDRPSCSISACASRRAAGPSRA